MYILELKKDGRASVAYINVKTRVYIWQPSTASITEAIKNFIHNKKTITTGLPKSFTWADYEKRNDCFGIKIITDINLKDMKNMTYDNIKDKYPEYFI